MAFTCFSQSGDSYREPIAVAMFISHADAKTPDNSRAHNQAATAQIKSHIYKNITYPELMVEYATEGTVMVEVSIANDGAVTGSVILESPSASFDAVVLKAMKTFGAIDTKGFDNAGVSKIIVPIRFRLK